MTVLKRREKFARGSISSLGFQYLQLPCTRCAKLVGVKIYLIVKTVRCGDFDRVMLPLENNAVLETHRDGVSHALHTRITKVETERS